jgi:hypothetical protein
MTFVIVFQCSPVNALWRELDPAEQLHCYEPQRLLLGYETTNLFLDILVLFIPVWVVRKLQLPPAKKLSAIVVFLLGIL